MKQIKTFAVASFLLFVLSCNKKDYLVKTDNKFQVEFLANQTLQTSSFDVLVSQDGVYFYSAHQIIPIRLDKDSLYVQSFFLNVDKINSKSRLQWKLRETFDNGKTTESEVWTTNAIK